MRNQHIARNYPCSSPQRWEFCLANTQGVRISSFDYNNEHEICPNSLPLRVDLYCLYSVRAQCIQELDTLG